MKRLGLVEVLRTAAKEIETVMRAPGGGETPRRPPDMRMLDRSSRLEGLRPRTDADAKVRASIPVSAVESGAREREGLPLSPVERRSALEAGSVRASEFLPAAWRSLTVPGAQAPLTGYVAISERVEVGDVLVKDPSDPTRMKPGRTAADSTVSGVVCGDPRGNNTLAPATFRGEAICKADAEYGAIAEGDFLTSSPTRGHAMRSWCRVSGTILGRALEALPTGRGHIRVMVTRR